MFSPLTEHFLKKNFSFQGGGVQKNDCTNFLAIPDHFPRIFFFKKILTMMTGVKGLTGVTRVRLTGEEEEENKKKKEKMLP